MKWLVALGFAVVSGAAALGAGSAGAAQDRLAPFLGEFQGQSGQAPGSLYVPLWSKPSAFELTLEREQDELVFAIGGSNTVAMRFVPISDRLYVLRTDESGPARETGFAWVDGDSLTIERMVARPGQPAAGMRFVVSFEDDHRRLAAYALKAGGDPVELLDTALKSPED
ncbi:MAG TPA: hypothetical protein VKQ29_02295 [Aliidongia sp.]|nr:hypothetical protein [Aliidongia sp.]